MRTHARTFLIGSFVPQQKSPISLDHPAADGKKSRALKT
jgi:hypothetical protein